MHLPFLHVCRGRGKVAEIVTDSFGCICAADGGFGNIRVDTMDDDSKIFI
jgi:hypothetical protein